MQKFFLFGLFAYASITFSANAQGVFMNPWEERAIGEQGHPKAIERDGGEYPDRELSRYIRSVASAAAYSSARNPDQFVITTLNNASFNAYARPGGFLYVHVGILPWMNDEAELMALLGHEVGHAINRHSARQYNRESVASRIIERAQERRRGREDPMLEQRKMEAWMALSEYGRDQEFESDDVSLQVLIRTDRDPAAATRMLSRLLQYQQIMDKLVGSSDETPDHSSSHPPGIDRVRRAATQMNQAGVTTIPEQRYRTRYLDAINGLIVPASPLYLNRPFRVQIYTVQAGDTVASLASRMQTFPLVQEDMFRSVNGLTSTDTLAEGMVVKIFTGVS